MFLNSRGIAAASVVATCLCAANADGVNLSISNYYASYQAYETPSNLTSPVSGTLASNDVLGANVGHGVTSGYAASGVLKGGSDFLVTSGHSPTFFSDSQSGGGSVSWNMLFDPTGNSLASFTNSINLHGVLSSFGTAGLPLGYSSRASFGVSVSVVDETTFASDRDAIGGSSLNGVYAGPTLPSTWTTKKFSLTPTDTILETVTLTWNDSLSQNNFGGGGSPPPTWTQSAVTDLNHTVLWGGSTGYDAGGNVVSDYHAYGQGGQDWSQPAPTPEPRSMLALAGGAALLVRRRRTRVS